MARADEFTKEVRNALAFRVNCRCSNPQCRCPTTGPMMEDEGLVRIGEAAHICAASKKGARYDPAMTSEERKSISNGIWLCCNCHTMIDKDVKRYPVETLRQWKQMAEDQAHWNLESGSQGQKKPPRTYTPEQRKRLTRFVAGGAAVLVLAAVLIAVVAGSLGNKEQYSEYIGLAKFEVENGNYLEAARLYDRAEAKAYDDASKLEALYGQGMCYFVYASESPEDSDEYYHNALRYYTAVITRFQPSDSEYYTDAMAECCEVYYFLDYSHTDSNWTAAVTWLENRYDPTDLSGMEALPAGQAANIALAVGMYYADVAEESFSGGTISAEYEKSMVCYQNALELLKRQKEENSQSFYDGDEVFFFLEEYANRTLNVCLGQMISGAEVSGALERIDAVIALCQTACANLDTEKISDMYIRLETTAGKAYWAKALLAGEEDTYTYFRKAYEALMPVVKLQLDEHYQALYYTDSGLYAVSTMQCSKSDLENIIELYRLQLAHCEEMGYIDYRVKVLVGACSVCETIFRFYDRYRDVAEPFAAEVVEEMESKWYTRLTESQIESLEMVKAMIQ